jgi:hypothetical protein
MCENLRPIQVPRLREVPLHQVSDRCAESTGPYCMVSDDGAGYSHRRRRHNEGCP